MPQLRGLPLLRLPSGGYYGPWRSVTPPTWIWETNTGGAPEPNGEWRVSTADERLWASGAADHWNYSNTSVDENT